MTKKNEVQKLAGWLRGSKDLADPPQPSERTGNLSRAEVSDVRDEPEEQYNIRIRRSLKKRLKRLVIEEEQPMGVILEKMLELYLQHRELRAERTDRFDISNSPKPSTAARRAANGLAGCSASTNAATRALPLADECAFAWRSSSVRIPSPRVKSSLDANCPPDTAHTRTGPWTPRTTN